MEKSAVWRPMLLLCCLLGFMLSGHIRSPAAHAAVLGSVVISLPGGNGNGAVGGPIGTRVHLAGTNFASSVTISLYTTTNNDPGQCRSGNPNNLGLTPFTPATVMTQQDGSFAIDSNWPNSANTPGAAYYICALPNNAFLGTLSSNNFTVSPTPTITVAPTMVAAGGQVTVSGANWLPPQAVTISLLNVAQNTALLNTDATSDQNGNFSAAITIPADAPGGTYTVSVTSNTNPNLKAVANGVLMITSNVTPTPTATPTVAVTPTTAPTATPTPPGTTGTPPPAGGNTDGTVNFLLITMGGLGILLVIVGVILFVMYSRQQ